MTSGEGKHNGYRNNGNRMVFFPDCGGGGKTWQ